MKSIKSYLNYINEFINIKKEIIDDKFALTINSKDELINILTKYKINTEKWGTGKYKTIDHLWNEILNDECVLFGYKGVLRREVSFVGAKIYYIKNNHKQKLVEDKAIFKDGRIRKRNIWYSMAEKFKWDENPIVALIRGIKEELNINIKENQVTYYNRVHFPENSDYPGIKSFHTGYSYLVLLNETQYKEEGYVENQHDKDIYFVWKNV